MGSSRGITIERRVLLFEVERRCSFQDCNERVFVSLTKQEALDYNGFECTLCERWNSDRLRKSDVPEWWDEVNTNQEMSH